MGILDTENFLLAAGGILTAGRLEDAYLDDLLITGSRLSAAGAVAAAAGAQCKHHNECQNKCNNLFHFGSSYKLLCCRNCLCLADRCVSVTI